MDKSTVVRMKGNNEVDLDEPAEGILELSPELIAEAKGVFESRDNIDETIGRLFKRAEAEMKAKGISDQGLQLAFCHINKKFTLLNKIYADKLFNAREG